MCDEDFFVAVTSRENADLERVYQFHRDLIVPTFAGKEFEDVATWVNRLQSQCAKGLLDPGEANTNGRLELAIAMIVRKSDGVVVGGAAHEIYCGPRCALISYLVVADDMRGKGFASVLVKTAYLNAESVLRQVYGHGEQLQALFIDVLQTRDDIAPPPDAFPATAEIDSGKMPLRTISLLSPNSRNNNLSLTTVTKKPVAAGQIDSAVRQKIYKRLNFAPLDLDLVLPGRHRGKRYNLALISTVFDPTTHDRFPTAVLLPFLHDLFAEVMKEEGSTDMHEFEVYRDVLQGRSHVGMGQKFWR